MSQQPGQPRPRSDTVDQWACSIYDGDESGHYTWHVDTTRDAVSAEVQARVLSASVQLSDPADYQGGELEVQLAEASVRPETPFRGIGSSMHPPG